MVVHPHPTCNTDASIETDLEILPQDPPGPVLASELALNTELVNSQTSNDVECMQIDYDHDRLAYKDLSQSSTNDASSIEEIKTGLYIKEFKEFQIKTIDAIAHGHDVVLVQPAGSGKSLCFTVPALLNSRKVCIVIEPVVAIINNQVEALQKKGIDALALGRAAENQRSKNYRRVFQSSDVPRLAFCTPEYLFGTPATSLSSGSAGQFHLLKAMQATLSVIVIDEAHKIFDRMPTYRPAFDEMHQLKELSCPIVAMSATLTSLQIDALKQKYLRSDKCLVLTKGVHRDNLHLCLQRYRRRKLVCVEQLDDEDESDKENAPEGETTTSTSMWADSINKIELMFKDHSTVFTLILLKM